MANMVRIQIDLPEDKVEALEALMKETGVTTKKDLFNNALTLLEWVIKEVKAGRTIASLNEANMSYKELAMPILLAVAQKAKKQAETQEAISA